MNCVSFSFVAKNDHMISIPMDKIHVICPPKISDHVEHLDEHFCLLKSKVDGNLDTNRMNTRELNELFIALLHGIQKGEINVNEIISLDLHNKIDGCLNNGHLCMIIPKLHNLREINLTDIQQIDNETLSVIGQNVTHLER